VVSVSRRKFAVLSASAGVAFLCVAPAAVLSRPDVSPRDQHFIPPFKKVAPHQRHSFLPMHKSLPQVEARLRNWGAVAAREAATLKTSGHPAIVRWRRQLAALPPGNGEELARRVNLMINQDVIYVSDWAHGHKSDIWYGPVETLEEGGDCEDYSLLKAVTLHAHGWPTQAMHLVAGILDNGQAHMMLAVDFGGGRHGHHGLLDNLSPQIHPRPFAAWTPKYQIGAHQQSLVYIKAG